MRSGGSVSDKLKPKILPPDDELQRLAAAVNSKLEPGIRVDFFCAVDLDGQIEIGTIYQCGDRRAVTRTRHVLSEKDAPAVLQAVSGWVAGVQFANRWSLDPKDAA